MKNEHFPVLLWFAVLTALITSCPSPAGSAKSSNAALSALSLTGYTSSALSGSDPVSQTVNLTPAFSSETYSYTASVPYSVYGVAPFYSIADSWAVSTPASGTVSILSEGTNTIDVLVTAQDGTTKRTYTIAVTRRSAPSLSILSPTQSSSAPAPWLVSVSGSFTPTSGNDIDTIKLLWGTKSSSCAMNAGTFSGDINLTGAANGSQRIYAVAYDSAGGTLDVATVDVLVSGSATGYSLSGTISISMSLSGTNYLCLVLDDGTYAIQITDPIAVTSTDFPKSYTLTGVVNGTYNVAAYIFTTDNIYVEYPIGGGGRLGVVVDSHNLPGADFTIAPSE